MANFEYGQQDLGIPNPFRFDGAMMAARGALMLPFGIILAFQIKGATAHHEAVLGWSQAAVSFALLSLALAAIGAGLFRMFRFYVGRNVPSNLAAPEAGDGAGANAGKGALYNASTLQQMLYDRKNPTFVEPVGWLSRGVHTLLPRLMIIPAPMRHVTVTLTEAIVYTAVILVLFGIALFSGATGLTNIASTAVGGWLAWFVLVQIFFIWYRRSPQLKTRDLVRAADFSARGLAFWIVVSIAAPAVLSWIQGHHSLPAPPESAYPWLFATLALGICVFALATFMAMKRMQTAHPRTEVSESRDHWQETINPMDIFRHFEMLMADQRVLELQNRVYRNRQPELFRQGGDNKGDFSGDTIQETQPSPIDSTNAGVHIGRMIGTAGGNLLSLAGAIWLFFSVGAVSEAMHLLGRHHFMIALLTLFNGIAGPVLLFLFGRMLITLSRLYWSEIAFESTLVRFFADGTYNESRLTTGNSVLDSTRSDNVLVRSNLTPWFQVSRLVSITLAGTGFSSLSGPRMVMEMHKHDDFISTLMTGMKSFLATRRNIADLNANDVHSAAGIQEVNEASRAQSAQAQASALGGAERLGAIAHRRDEDTPPEEGG